MNAVEGGDGFVVQVDRNPWLPPAGTRTDAIVSITGPERPGAASDVLEVLVVDTSGSMLGDKIEQARRATATAIAALPDGVLFAVVAGASRAYPVYPVDGAVRADPHTRSEAALAVRNLIAGGGTRLGVWLRAVRAIAERHPGAARHALLVTDGRGSEPALELWRALDDCRGVFTCDCRGIGVDWAVEELRTISAELHGDVDIVPDAAGLSADVAGVLDAAARRSVADVVLRLWTPEQSRVRSVVQVAPAVRDLSPGLRATGPHHLEVPIGDWGAETREYHVRLDVPPRPVGDRMLAARVEVAARGCPPAAAEPITVTRTDDPALHGIPAPRVVHYAGQVELATAVRDGLHARRGGDEATATTLLGRARELAAASGHRDAMDLIDGVVEHDERTGTISLRRDVDAVDEMTLDARGGRSTPPPEA